MTSTANLFVTKLPREIVDSDLMRIFSAFNPSSAKVMLDATTGKSKGFGFVLFPSAQAGQAALDALSGSTATVYGRTFHLIMQPSKHDGRISCAETNALYVRNIPMTASKEEIQSFLSTYGTLVYSVMRQDNYGSPVWVVYAEYDCVDCAKTSLGMFHGSSGYFASTLPILAKFADSNEIKEDRRRRRHVDVDSDHEHSASVSVGDDSAIVPTPKRFQHNPYANVFKTDSPPNSCRKACARVGPWISLAAC